MTVLHIAVRHATSATVGLLLDRGADITAKYKVDHPTLPYPTLRFTLLNIE